MEPQIQIPLQPVFARAFAHEKAGRNAEARAIYQQILELVPGHPGASLKLAEHELREGALDSAHGRLEGALRGATAQALPVQEIWYMLARVDVARGNLAAARRACERALEFAPDMLPALQLCAWVALEGGDADAAEAVCRRGLERHPRDVELLYLLGRALRASGALPAAYRALTECAALAANDSAVLMSLAAVALDLGLAVEARARLQRVIAAGTATAETWDNLGLAHQMVGDLDAAVGAFTRAVELKPDLAPALSNLVLALRAICAWDQLDAREPQWRKGADAQGSDPRWSPFVALLISDSEDQQRRVARLWSTHLLPPVTAPALLAARGTRLRVGYLSTDLRQHPMAYLTAGLFEHHDRAQVETFAYSLTPDDGSPIRRRVQAAFEHWVEVAPMTDSECARRIAADGIDVLIDLMGHTHGSRLEILARRPAPAQLHYMGFPGTIGFDGIDAVIADDVVVPPGHERFFHERVLRLPRCYYVTDDRRALPERAPRAGHGLPEDALVLVCFNQTNKLSRRFFAFWMEALARTPDAVLWLYARNPLAQANLRAEAARAGVDAARIIFAPTVPQDEHIARLRAADLALDVLPYGSHTTGSDALWAGVPLLSCRGTTFAGRVGASLLHAVEQDELVAESPEDYREALLRLAGDRDRLRGYKDFLDRERHRLQLFDTEGFARDWERLLVTAYDAIASERPSA